MDQNYTKRILGKEKLKNIKGGKNYLEFGGYLYRIGKNVYDNRHHIKRGLKDGWNSI
ncbi:MULTISPECIES: hypothetical protein [Aerococcus]|uniref:hypothetical protein n=1 Tax=Aerococcus TaxID=1375 RepID=UPI00143AA8A9|nr:MULTISPECIES: hypothetical protein [Aerococcus]MDK6369274.1 hypothetical protein [Aerococcus sp. UMB9870]MDK6679098.1 hypothetical protein [Aerococcus sp. UMB8608]MDK6687005.1 hypothetical protein [Aerococcus sp. UMB8623]MDK6941244.1 hypothetical protein [Aerococcus sp. UMB8487]